MNRAARIVGALVARVLRAVALGLVVLYVVWFWAWAVEFAFSLPWPWGRP